MIWITCFAVEERELGFLFPLPPHTERGLAACPSKDASASSFAMIAGTTVPLAPSLRYLIRDWTVVKLNCSDRCRLLSLKELYVSVQGGEVCNSAESCGDRSYTCLLGRTSEGA